MIKEVNKNIIDEIKDIEQREISVDMRLFHIHSLIKTTKEIADLHPLKKSFRKNQIEIKRNLKLDLLIWFFIAVVAIFPISYVTVREIQNAYRNPLGIIMGIFLVALLLFVAFRNLTSKKLRFPIILNTKQIIIGGESYLWTEIENTFCVYRARRSFFVIGFRNGDIKYFNIGNQLGFRYSDHDFAAIVEYFKNKNSLFSIT